MSLINRIPQELCNLINEMNPEHRVNFHKVSEELEIHVVKKRINAIKYEWECHPDRISITALLALKMPDYEYVLSILSKCKCCVRHQTKRPITINNPGESIINIPGAFKYYQKHECECPCRQTSRNIYRMCHNGYIPYDDEE